MNPFYPRPPKSYRALDLREFISALNQSVPTAIADLNQKAALNRKPEVRAVNKGGAFAVLVGALLAAAGCFAIETIHTFAPSFGGSTVDRMAAHVFWAYMVLAVPVLHWLSLWCGRQDSVELATRWSQPLSESTHCQAFQKLTQDNPELSLLPQASSPRALYVADYLLAVETVKAAASGLEVQRSRDACASLHTQAFSGATQG